MLSPSLSSTPSSRPDVQRPSATDFFGENISEKHVMAPLDTRPLWMAEVKYGSRVKPSCDRCRKEKKDCVKSTTWCQVCTDAHRHCTWNDAPPHEMDRGNRFATDVNEVDDIDGHPTKFPETKKRSLFDRNCVRPIKRQKKNDVPGIAPAKYHELTFPPSTTYIHKGSLPDRRPAAVHQPSESIDAKIESSPFTANRSRGQKSQTPALKVAVSRPRKIDDLLKLTAYGQASPSEEAELDERQYNVEEAQETDLQNFVENKEHLRSPNTSQAGVRVLSIIRANEQGPQEGESKDSSNVQSRELSPPYSPHLDIDNTLSDTFKGISMEPEFEENRLKARPSTFALNSHTNNCNQRNGVDSETNALNEHLDYKQLMECRKCRKKLFGKTSQHNDSLWYIALLRFFDSTN